MMITFVLLFLILLLIFVKYLSILKINYDHFKQNGLSGPKWILFLGHCHILWSIDNLSEQLRRWTTKYGSIYVLFEGRRPIYVVSDVDFLYEVFVKQFSSFNIRSVPFVMKEMNEHEIHMFGASGLTWRRQRQIISPAFSTNQMKLMSQKMNQCIQSLIHKLKMIENNQEEINIYEFYQRLAMDVICHCAFDLNIDMQNDIQNILMKKCKLAITENPERLFLTKLGQLFPFLIDYLPMLIHIQVFLSNSLRFLIPSYFLPKIEEIPALWILNQVQTIVNQRKNISSNRTDLLELMMDNLNANSESIQSKQLYEKEICANILLFMITGFDSVSTALASCSYILATHEHFQDRLRQEIDEQQWKNDYLFDYDIIMNMTYIDLFIREVLRMYPIALTATKRECHSTTFVSGHRIQKGSLIQPDILTIHYDEHLWGPQDPNLFVPERHQTKRHPMAFLPFGAGPRTCLGMRFAFLEIKICLCQILRQYIVLPTSNTQQGFQHNQTYLTQPNAVYIKLKQR